MKSISEEEDSGEVEGRGGAVVVGEGSCGSILGTEEGGREVGVVGWPVSWRRHEKNERDYVLLSHC